MHPLQELDIDETDELSVGEDLVIAGYPLGTNKLTIHRGFLSAKGYARDFPIGKLNQQEMGCPLLQIDGTINEGFSGGPVIRLSNKKVCGFISSKYGIMKDFNAFRRDLNNLLQDPFTKQLTSQQNVNITIQNVKFGPFVTFILNSLDILSKSMQLIHVGIGYAIDSKVINQFTS